MKTIKLFLGFFLFSCSIIIATPALNDDIKNIKKTKFEELSAELKKDYSNLIDTIDGLKRDNENLKNKINLTNEKVNQTIERESNYISFITWTSGIIIAFVSILFGLFSILMFGGNKKIISESEKLLNDTNSLKEDFELWFKLRQEEYKKAIRNDYKKTLIVLQNTNRLEKLKELLKNKSDDLKEIYSLITPLSLNPTIEYKPYFNKLINLNLSNEITELAKKGIENLIEE